MEKKINNIYIGKEVFTPVFASSDFICLDMIKNRSKSIVGEKIRTSYNTFGDQYVIEVPIANYQAVIDACRDHIYANRKGKDIVWYGIDKNNIIPCDFYRVGNGFLENNNLRVKYISRPLPLEIETFKDKLMQYMKKEIVLTYNYQNNSYGIDVRSRDYEEEKDKFLVYQQEYGIKPFVKINTVTKYGE